MIEKVERITDQLSDEEKATLAAELLNEVDPSASNLARFFAELDDIPHDELINRAEDEDERG